MKSCFNSEMRITQVFGNDFIVNGKLYYQSMGIKGHDGIDVIPKDLKDIRIYNIFGGIVVEKYFHIIYGNRIAIWNKDKNIIEYHNHLAEIDKNIQINDYISEHTYLGLMGNTGKVFGAHNHYAIARSNDKGERIGRDNGFFGYIDPLPFL